MSQANFKPGEAAKVRHSIHSPQPGRAGIVVDVNIADPKGPYLVVFSDGLQFRYKASELESVDKPAHTNVIDALYRVISEKRNGLWRGTHSR